MNALHFTFGKHPLFCIQVAGPFYWHIYETSTLYSPLAFQNDPPPPKNGLTSKKDIYSQISQVHYL